MSRHPSTDDRSFSHTGPSNPSYPSAAYRRLLEQVERFARDDRATILLEGESGTGKTTLARYIHSRSRRASQPFQQVVLATIEDSLAASALFGHVDGAFTDARRSRPGHFASANGGTVFLDEIGKASLTVQHRLLHIVEYGSFHPVGADREVRVDVRIVAATNVSLAAQAQRNSFSPTCWRGCRRSACTCRPFVSAAPTFRCWQWNRCGRIRTDAASRRLRASTRICCTRCGMPNGRTTSANWTGRCIAFSSMRMARPS